MTLCLLAVAGAVELAVLTDAEVQTEGSMSPRTAFNLLRGTLSADPVKDGADGSQRPAQVCAPAPCHAAERPRGTHHDAVRTV